MEARGGVSDACRASGAGGRLGAGKGKGKGGARRAPRAPVGGAVDWGVGGGLLCHLEHLGGGGRGDRRVGVCVGGGRGEEGWANSIKHEARQCMQPRLKFSTQSKPTVS